MSLNFCQYPKKFQSSSWINCRIFIAIAVIISGCSESPYSIQQRILASQEPPSRDRNSPQYYELKSKSVDGGDTFSVINPITQEEIKIRLACINAVWPVRPKPWKRGMGGKVLEPWQLRAWCWAKFPTHLVRMDSNFPVGANGHQTGEAGSNGGNPESDWKSLQASLPWVAKANVYWLSWCITAYADYWLG